MSVRRKFSGYDTTLTHIGFYNREFITYEVVVNKDDLGKITNYLRGEHREFRLAIGVCESRGRYKHICEKEDPEFTIDLNLAKPSLEALAKGSYFKKRLPYSNVLTLKVRADKDYEAIVDRLHRAMSEFLTVDKIERTA